MRQSLVVLDFVLVVQEYLVEEIFDVIVFEKLRFCNGLVWMVGLTIEKKRCFKMSPA